MNGPNPSVDSKTLALLEATAKVTEVLGIEWMVTGAGGRVLLLEGVYGLPHGRATQDVDLGIMVASWDHYQALVDRLQEDGRFQPDPKQQQRLLFQGDSMLDLVPFGEIETEDRIIRWPPDEDFVLNVIGFREAYADVVDVMLDGLKVPVISPVGLMLLKLVAWSDRHWTQPMKDAADLAYVLRYYGMILTEEVLFDEHIDDIEASEYDIDLASIRVLGRKIEMLGKKNAGDFILALLEEELQQETDSQLVRDISSQIPGVGIERTYTLLQYLKAGLLEEMNK